LKEDILKMTNATMLLHWDYLIFLLPMGIAAILLLLSSLRLGHHGGHGGHHAHGPALRTPSATHAAPHVAAQGHAAHPPSATNRTAQPDGAGRAGRQGTEPRPHITVSNHLVLNLTGANRAPWAMILEAFLLIWGVCGLWAHQLMAHAEQPSPRQIGLLVSIALVGGVVGARIAASLIGRFMPQDETLIVSRNELIGLTGTIVFATGETSGRIHVYDEYGTLHDEMCRIAPGYLTIDKGRQAIVLDMDMQGRLLVEEML
jgi:membrane protein implicated in regulation of membrane protease activity